MLPPVALQVGPVQIRWYGIAMAAAMAAAWLVARKLAPRWGGTAEHVDGMVPWLVIGGLVGARLVAVVAFEPSYYIANPGELLAIWHGGISILGGLAGGAAALWLYCRRHRLNPTPYLASLAVALPLAQGIGRWGNYFNQELYGRPSDLPWAVAIDGLGTFQPLFLYESLLNLALFITLWVRRGTVNPAQLPWLYLLGYGVIRFAMEFGRTDPVVMLGPLRLSQLLALGLVVAGVSGLAIGWRTRPDSNRRSSP